MIDPAAAQAAASAMASTQSGIDDAAASVAAAERLSELEVAAAAVLAELDGLLRSAAQQLLAATAAAISFRLPAIDAAPSTPWNQVEQLASHNSYKHPGAIADLYARGIRTFELDAHRGDPTELPTVDEVSVSWLGRVALDGIDHESDRVDDWRVYHHSLDAASAYPWLSDGLAAIAALPPTDPVTVFIDVKDRFGDAQNPAALDELLSSHLGPRLYTPRDMLSRSPGATTLRAAVQQAGWPTVGELRGRVIVVLTDETEQYGTRPSNHAAFIAERPRPDRTSDPNVVFHNASADRITAAEIDQIRRAGGVVRVWNGGADGSNANYLAVDVEAN